METVENPMLKPAPAPGPEEWPYNPPCRSESEWFREFLIETYETVEQLIGEPEVMDVLIRKHLADYDLWRKEQ